MVIRLADEEAVVAAPGRFDAETVAACRPALDELVAGGPAQVRLDLSRTISLDSSGIGAIVYLHKRLAAQGRRLVLAGLSGEPGNLLRSLRVDRLIPTETTPAAVEHRDIGPALGMAA
jgi:anti-anti-sigma factor